MVNMERGITIAELLIAIVIIGVMAAMVLVRFSGQSERAVTAEAVGMLSAIRQAEVAFELENPGTYAPLVTDLDVTVPADGTSAFDYSVDAAGEATALRNADGNSQTCDGKTIILSIGGDFSGDHPYGPNPDALSTC